MRGNGWIQKLQSNVFKWWRLVILPAFRIDNNRMAGEPVRILPAQEQQPEHVEQTDVPEQSDAREVAAEPRTEIDVRQQDEERIAAIMRANRVNVDSYIEEGKHRREQQNLADEETVNAENLRRAQEIMDRLNREAAEDEAKKQAELEACIAMARQDASTQ